MKRLLLLVLFAVVFVPVGSLQAATLPPDTLGVGAIAQQIHIQGIVPPMRVIYIDEQAKVVRVVGYTSDNSVSLTVSHDGTNTPASMTGYIYDQYQRLLADNDNYLLDCETYQPSEHSFMQPSLLKMSFLRSSFF